MRLPALGGPGPVPGRRPQQRVPEGNDRVPLLQDSGGLVQAPSGVQPARGERVGQRGQRLVVAGGGEQHRGPAAGGQPGQLLLVEVAEPGGHRQRRRQGGRAGALHRGEDAAALEQGERVARGLGGQPVGDHRGVLAPEQPAGVGGRQSGERLAVDVVDGRSGSRARPPGQQKGDPVVPQPAGGEQQRVAGLPVQPGQVVDDHQQRRRLGRGGEQAQGGGGHGEALAERLGLAPPDGRLQSMALRRGEGGQMRPESPDHPEQAGVGEHRVGPHALDPDGGPAVGGGGPGGGLGDRGLADPSLALEDQRAEGSLAGGGPEGADPVQHVGPADQAGAVVECGVAHSRTVGLNGQCRG